MRLFLIVMGIMSCASGPALAQADPAFRIVETSAISGRALNSDEALYVRIEYTSEQPLRFRVEGYRNNTLITTGVRYNPSPISPAGRGEALAWLSFKGPLAIDELRVSMLDSAWRPLATRSHRAALLWSDTRAVAAQPPEWARRLSQQQQQAAGAALQRHADGGSMLATLMVLGVPVYVLLQVLTLWFARGRWRIAAALPLVIAVPLAAQAGAAYMAGSNLWPLLMILCAPFGATYLAALLALAWMLGMNGGVRFAGR